MCTAVIRSLNKEASLYVGPYLIDMKQNVGNQSSPVPQPMQNKPSVGTPHSFWLCSTCHSLITDQKMEVFHMLF